MKIKDNQKLHLLSYKMAPGYMFIIFSICCDSIFWTFDLWFRFLCCEHLFYQSHGHRTTTFSPPFKEFTCNFCFSIVGWRKFSSISGFEKQIEIHRWHCRPYTRAEHCLHEFHKAYIGLMTLPMLFGANWRTILHKAMRGYIVAGLQESIVSWWIISTLAALVEEIPSFGLAKEKENVS